MIHTIIELSHIKKSFSQGVDTVSILQGISTSFVSGNSYAITGVSGSGKSSLLHIIAGFDDPTEGMVLFNKKPLQSFSTLEKENYAQRVIGFLFQKPYLIKELSVIENIMLPAQIAGDSPEHAYIRARELLDVVGLVSYANHKPGVLSGGQQQRISLARALCNKPIFLCADEPTASLDAHNRDEIVALIKYGMSAWNMGVIVCTHDMMVAHAMHNKFVLKDGVLRQLVG